jgi:hypothetical protein
MSTQVKQEGDFKIKKPKKFSNKENEPIKVDLSKPAEAEDVTKVVIKEEDNAIQEQSADDGNAVVEQPKNESNSQEVVEEVRDTEEQTVEPIIQETTGDEAKEEEVINELSSEVEQAVEQKEETGVELPENIQKVVDFMKDTGGTLQDYVRLNADYKNINDVALLKEYYAKTKPYLDQEDVSLLLEDFSYDEELDDEREVRKKKIAYKEEIGKARNYLEGLKSKYYDEIKLRPGVTQEQKKAMDFFNRYKEDEQIQAKTREDFLSENNKFFSNDFKGFDFNLGEKKFRYTVKDSNAVKENQSDLKSVIGKFLNNKGTVKNYADYHKALYAARNADTIAQHFYEQGKADAVKEITAKSNNIKDDVRQSAPGSVFVNGLKVRSISGSDSTKLKIKKKQFKN